MSNSTNKAAISLTTGLEDAEKVTVAFLVAVGAAEIRPTDDDVPDQGGGAARRSPALRSAWPATAARRWRRCSTGTRPAGGRYLVCPICFNSKRLDAEGLIAGADLAGTVQLWEWIGDGATTFSY